MHNHNALKKAHEEAAGQRFMKQYNTKNGSRYELVKSGERPDLTYDDPDRGRLGVEVTTIYYDKLDARTAWDMARGRSSGGTCGFVNPDEKLLTFINRRIGEKCKDFASAIKDNLPCLLLCHGRPAITDAQDVEDKVLCEVEIPQCVPFAEIWLALDLPNSSQGPGGYQTWRLYPRPQVDEG